MPGTLEGRLAHILVRPQGPRQEKLRKQDGFQLHQRMQATPGQETYGRFRYDIDTRSINVMGTRRNGKWKIYVQKIEKHHLAVLSVHRLFPPE
jgi:hypothetical protein